MDTDTDSSRIPSESFLNELKALYNASNTDTSAWCCIAAVAFSGLNIPEAVPALFEYGVRCEGIEGRVLARRIKDALFKVGLMYGFPKSINGLAALQKVLPKELQETETLRPDPTKDIEAMKRRGQEFMSQTYGETFDASLSFLKDIYPDLGGDFFMVSACYGYIYGYTEILNAAETSLCIATAAIVAGTIPQLKSHRAGARRNGASEDEVEGVNRIVAAIAKRYDVDLGAAGAV